jgi:Domain of unknown function (DUF4440)
MGQVHLLSDNDLTRMLAWRLEDVWDAYVRRDEETHNKYLTEDYRAVHPDGSVHLGRPSAADMAAAPIEDYRLADLQAWPVSDDGAIASYTAEVQVRNALTSGCFQFIVGEVWIKNERAWLCRYYHATPLK